MAIAIDQFTISVINDGAPGRQGVSVSNVIPEYRLSDSSTELTGDTTLPAYQWNTTKPEVPSGKYIWTRNRNELSNGTTVYSDAVCDVVTSGLVFDVDRNTNAITQKVWETDITTSINSYDSSTTQGIRDRVTQTETDITGINTTISEVQSTLSTKADGSTVTDLTSRVQTVEDTAATHTRQISETSTAIGNTTTTANQTADQLSWVIDTANKTSSTFTFKNRVMELVNADLVIKDPAGNSTVISGGKLSTDAIKSTNYVAGTSGSPYSSTGTFLDLATGNIYMPSFGVDATTGAAYFSGQINAESGFIGGTNGFTIASGKMYTNNKNSITSLNNGIYIGTEGISFGAGGPGNDDCPFSVTSSGYLYSTSGQVGGWRISQGSISNSYEKVVTIDGVDYDCRTTYTLANRDGTPGSYILQTKSINDSVAFDTYLTLTVDGFGITETDHNDNTKTNGSRINNRRLYFAYGGQYLIYMQTYVGNSSTFGKLEIKNGDDTTLIRLDGSNGKITSDQLLSTSGIIGGWTITDNHISAAGTYTDSDDNEILTSIYIGDGANQDKDVLRVQLKNNTSHRITCPFYLLADGTLTTSGAISCNTLTSTGAISGGSITTSGAINCSSLTSSGVITGAGITSTVNVLVSNATNGVQLQLTTNNTGTHGLLSNGYCNSSGTFVSDSQWLLYRNNTGHVTIPRTLTVDNIVTAGYMKKTTGGDVVCCETTTAVGMQYRLHNSLRNGALHLSQYGNLGIYDDTNGSWVIASGTNGDVQIPHQLTVTSRIYATAYYANYTDASAEAVIQINTTGANGASYYLKNGSRAGKLRIDTAYNFGLFDMTNNNWVLYSGTNQIVNIPHHVSVSNNITAGGSITSGSNGTGVHGAVYAISQTRNVALHANAAGNAGVYDAGNSAWILVSGTSQSVSIPHPLSITGTLSVSSNLSVSGTYILVGGTAVTTSPYIQVANNKNNVALNCTQSSAGVYHYGSTGSTTAKWLIYIGTNGTVTANTSDIRYKNIYGNISEYETLTMLRGLDVINFSYKEDEKKIVQNGFKAQQMRDLLKSSGIGYRPYLDIQDVTCEESEPLYDLDAPEGNVLYGVDYSRFTPLLVSGWQIHDSRINELEAEIASLRSEIAALKRM